jgi:hypothetical protein
LEAVIPGYGKDIDSVLAGQASKDLIMKVENSLKKVIIRGKSEKDILNSGSDALFFWTARLT